MYSLSSLLSNFSALCSHPQHYDEKCNQKNVMLTLKVEVSRVLIGRTCRAGGSRASEQGGTGNSGCGHWWAFRLYFVNRPLRMYFSLLFFLLYF